MSSEIEGTWTLIAWRQEYDDGRVVEPFGPRPGGVISYLGERMSCILTATNRQDFTTGGQWNADPAEKAGAYDSCLAYAGRFSLEDGVVTHHVEYSLFPNWVGGDQSRQIQWRGSELHLVARLEEGTSEARTARLSWRPLAQAAPE